MGCFNVSCAVSHITIHEGERCFLFPLIPNIGRYKRLHGFNDEGVAHINPASMYIHQTDIYAEKKLVEIILKKIEAEIEERDDW